VKQHNFTQLRFELYNFFFSLFPFLGVGVGNMGKLGFFVFSFDFSI
jgi:hypothetical protein